MMNRTHLACRLLMTIVAFVMQPSCANGQSNCPCQRNPSSGQRLASDVTPPLRFSMSSSYRDGMTRDPFTGTWVAAGSQMRWSRTVQSAHTATSISPDDPATDTTATTGSKATTDTASSSSGSAAYGGGPSVGGQGNAGGASVGSFGGGSSGGSGSFGGASSTPRASRFSSGGGSSGRSRSGYLNTSERTATSSSTTPVVNPTPTPDPTPSPNPAPNPGGGGLSEIPLPVCPVPPLLPDIPSTGGNPVSPPDVHPGNDAGEAPIVPEPGSIVLLSVALGVSGVGYIRRRRNSRLLATV